MTTEVGVDWAVWTDPTWWTTDRATLLLTALGLIVAVLAVGAGLGQLHQTVKDSQARSRPMATAELRHVPHTLSTALVIKNYGPSIARDLRVTFDPPLPTSSRAKDGQQSIIPFMVKRYANPVAVLPPGAELSNVYYAGRVGDGRAAVNAEATAEAFTVTIAYRDDNGHNYEDDFPLDMNLVHTETEATGSSSPEAQLKIATQHLKTIAQSLANVARAAETVAEQGDRRERGEAPPQRDSSEMRRRSHQELVNQLLPGLHTAPIQQDQDQ